MYQPIPSQDTDATSHLNISTQNITVDEDLKIKINGYRLSNHRIAIFYFISIISFGLFNILSRWFPKLSLFIRYSPCPLSMATHVYVQNQWNVGNLIEIEIFKFNGKILQVFPKELLSCDENSTLDLLKCFQYRYIKFIFNPSRNEFIPNDIWRDYNWTCIDQAMEGIEHLEIVNQRKMLFGDNSLNIQEKSTLRLLTDEVLHPFFMFQIVSMILWSIDNYYYYAACIFIISLATIIATLIETKENMRKMREFSRFSCSVRVWRFGDWKTVNSVDLVPGDVFEITSGFMEFFPCDAVLLAGDCIVNESMLTGESIPCIKSPINNQELSLLDFEKEDPAASSSMSRFFLFSGTKIIRSRSSIPANLPNQNSLVESLITSEQLLGGGIAMAVRTGFNTTKGNLIRTMLFPKPNKFRFYRDSFRFIGALSIIAGIGFLASFYNFFKMGISWGTIFIRALDLFTIVVPPALPATMLIGTSFAISRLKKFNIFCISPPRVNICGKIDIMCFDKTGTLTEEGLDVLGFRFSVPCIQKSDFERSEQSDLEFLSTDCRFSRLYTSVNSVIPKPIKAHSLSRASNISESLNARKSLSQISGISLDFNNIPEHPNAELDFPYPLIACAMATCHSIKVVGGELVGDPMDLKMFEFTKWQIQEGFVSANGIGNTILVKPVVLSANTPSLNSHSQLGIVKTFDFVSSLRRMGVIVCRLSKTLVDFEAEMDFDVFVKGAPEVLQSICDPASIPKNYEDQLRDYAHHGYRVIAIAHRQLVSKSLKGLKQFKRSEIEKELKFLGFIIFENKLKPGTSIVVQELHAAKIRQVMVTGDNVLTSISVSRECGLVNSSTLVYVPRFIFGKSTDPKAQIVWEDVDGDSRTVDPVSYQEVITKIDRTPVVKLNEPRNESDESQSFENDKSAGSRYCLAITGDVLAWMLDFASDESLQKMLIKTQIFARMSPDQKHFLVERFQWLGYCVGFTGDGSNDCGALKNADVGLSLSEEEASVAAPFTSKSKDLSCVLRIMREGRAALVTSFSCFKYMALYSLIQFTSVSILYSQANNLADAQYLYIDICIIIPIAIFMGRSSSHPILSPKPPTASLVSKRVLTSLVGQIMIQVFVQLYLFRWIQSQHWYIPGIKPGNEDANFPSMENTTLFYVGTFQYMIVALVYNEGPPYRESMFKNGAFVAAILLLWGFTTMAMFLDNSRINDILQLVEIPSDAKIFFFVIVLVNLFLSWICEIYIFKWIYKFIDILWWRLKSKGGDAIERKRLKWSERGKTFRLIQDELLSDFRSP